MKRSLILASCLIFMSFLLSACRSDADRMAEFCLNFDEAVQATDDCSEMASRLEALLSGPQPHLRRNNICERTTACLPCRNGARKLLNQCGYDEAMKPVFDQMHFSKIPWESQVE